MNHHSHIKMIIQDVMELGQKLHDEDKQEHSNHKKDPAILHKKIDWVLKWKKRFLDEPDLKDIWKNCISNTTRNITGIDIFTWVFYDPSETHK